MNNLILYASEVNGAKAVVVGERARYVRERHALSEGVRVQAAEFNGSRGKALVVHIENERIEFEVNFSSPILKRLPVKLIVGVCRPQTVKKIINIATMCGVESLDFVRVASSEKSYLQSKVLTSEEIDRRVLEGLEQSCDSVAPDIKIHRRFRPFVEDELPNYTESVETKLIASTTQPDSSDFCDLTSRPEIKSAVLAVGPEAGWSNFELEAFYKRGFQAVSLGERIYRTEVALTMLLGQIQLSFSPDPT